MVLAGGMELSKHEPMGVASLASFSRPSLFVTFSLPNFRNFAASQQVMSVVNLHYI